MNVILLYFVSKQLLKVAFDEEVSQESVESIRKMINRLRHPQAIHHLFAFAGHHSIPQTPSRREKDKPGYGTLRWENLWLWLKLSKLNPNERLAIPILNSYQKIMIRKKIATLLEYVEVKNNGWLHQYSTICIWLINDWASVVISLYIISYNELY